MLNESTATSAAGNDPPPNSEVFLPTENIIAQEVQEIARPGTFEQIIAACDECMAYNAGDGFFDRQWDERVAKLLVPSYKLFKLVAGDTVRLDAAISASKIKATKATRNRPALVAVKITARPKNTAHNKLCSSWAVILDKAHAENIPVDQFFDWVMKPKANQASTNTKNTRKELNNNEDSNLLQVRLTGTDGPIDEVLALPPAAHATLLDALTAPGSQSARIQRLGQSLLILADELALIEAEVSASPSLGDAEVNSAVAEPADA